MVSISSYNFGCNWWIFGQKIYLKYTLSVNRSLFDLDLSFEVLTKTGKQKSRLNFSLKSLPPLWVDIIY